MTVASVVTDSAKAAIALSAFDSCRKPMIALMRNAENHPRLDPLLQESSNHTGSQQNVQRLIKLLQKSHPGAFALFPVS